VVDFIAPPVQDSDLIWLLEHLHSKIIKNVWHG
jgi:hypothetical protein